MRKLGWIVFSGILVSGMASAQQASNPTSSPSSQSAVVSPAPPAHPATEEQIREYLSLVGLDKAAHQMMDSAVSAMQSTSAPYYPASFWSDMRTEFRNADVISVYVQVYQRYVSQSDMQAVIDFYRSPAGKAFLAAQPLTVRDASALMRKKGGEIGVAVYDRHKDEIEAAKKQYEAGKQRPAIDLGTPPQ